VVACFYRLKRLPNAALNRCAILVPSLAELSCFGAPKPGVRDGSRPGVGGLGRDGQARPAARPNVTNIVTDLLYFDSRTCVFKLFFDFCRLFLVDALLDGLGGGLDKILSLLEAEARDRPDFLDHVYLLLANRS
jgi:hypothetical protein